MKRIRIVSTCVILVACILLAMLFTACDSTPQSETIVSENTQVTEGSYFVFKTDDIQEYVNFLENFNEAKYEIIDISLNEGHYPADSIYFVTYKSISE